MGEDQAKVEIESLRDDIQGRRFWLGMKRALVRVLHGESYRAAAAAEGVGWRELHRNAKTVLGLPEAHLVAWQRSWGREFPPVWRHHFGLESADRENGISTTTRART